MIRSENEVHAMNNQTNQQNHESELHNSNPTSIEFYKIQLETIDERTPNGFDGI